MSSARARGIAIALPLLMAGWLTAFASWAEVGQKKECATGVGGGCKGPDQQQAPPQPPYDHDGGTRGLDESGDKVSPPSLMDDREWTPELGEELDDRLEDCAGQRQQMADALRGGRRRVSHPELNASECLDLDRDPGLYGGFVNHCEYDVLASYCAYRPRQDSWTTSFDCEQQEGGMFDVPAKTAKGPGRRTVHTHGAQMFYWAACRMPGVSLVDVKFVPGKGLTFRCETWDKAASPPSVPEIIPGCTADVVEDVIHDREELLRLGREEEERARAAAERAALAQQQAALRQRQGTSQRQAGIDAAAVRDRGPSAADCRATDAAIQAYVDAHNAAAAEGYFYGKTTTFEAARQYWAETVQYVAYAPAAELRAAVARDDADVARTGCRAHSIGMIQVSDAKARESCAATAVMRELRLCAAERNE